MIEFQAFNPVEILCYAHKMKSDSQRRLSFFKHIDYSYKTKSRKERISY